jgi:hypothetical protein
MFREKQLYLCGTWYLLFCVDDCLVCILDSHPHTITKTRCRIERVVSADDGHIVTRNMQRKEINWYAYQTVIHSELQVSSVTYEGDSNENLKYFLFYYLLNTKGTQ